MDLDTFVRGLPKAELHVHLEGTLEPEQMLALAQRNGVKLRFSTVEEIRAAYAFTDLQSFLDLYYEGASVLVTEADFHDLALAYLERARADGVRHAELFFDPQTHTDRGVLFETVLAGLWSGMEEARTRFGIGSKLIACFLRHLSPEAAMETLGSVVAHKDKIVAVGLDSSEVGHPPSKFRAVFERARAEGLLTVAHAGEEGPPSYIWEALWLLGVSRIDHGVRALEDEDLLDRLVEDDVPLTVCPLSNVRLKVFARLEDHPLAKLMDRGVRVTLNSDDPAYFGGYIGENYLATARALGLSRDDLIRLARNSIEASFLGPAERHALLVQLDAFVKSASK